jgi:hypothetical protein
VVNQVRNAKFVVEAVACAHLSLLLALQLSEANSWSRPGRTLTEQRAISGGVLLLAAPAAALAGPDQLALRHQRHDHMDPGCSETIEQG